MTSEARPYIICCIACDEPMKPGDRFYSDYSGGFLHAECSGSDREGFVDLETGEPLKDDEPIPEPSIWEPDAALSEEGR